MLDMDRFKQANDVFGHAYGDEVIATMSAALKASFPRDIVCRMGGDEFMVWCEHASVRTLEETLEKRSPPWRSSVSRADGSSCSQCLPATCWPPKTV